MQIEPQCWDCIHYEGGFQCRAYPEMIPDAIIIFGEVDHREPYPGDNGIQFKATGE